ncbi:MAG: hypothetical protein ACP5HM_12310 [Anaerolineae bacterium]
MNSYRKYLIAVILIVLSILLVSGEESAFTRIDEPSRLTQSLPTRPYAETPGSPGDFSLYLPLAFERYPPPRPVFGIQMSAISESGGLSKVVEAQTAWVGGIVINWAEVEPTRGERNWQALATQEQYLQNAANNDLTPIVLVRYTPQWARKYPSIACGPMASTHFEAFADFMHDVVARYSQAPYNAKYWEIWNEPDIDPDLVPSNSPYGCWGDADDPYYGGGYYADMLKVIYPRMKQADPEAQIMVGGLLLDCDPHNPPAADPENPSGVRKDCTPAKFLEGVLLNDGGAFFDGVSFHAYDYYAGALGRYANGNWASAWNTTGPVIIAKKNYIQNLLHSYGATDKFLVNTESALLGDGYTDDSIFEETKAYYLTQSYAIAIAEGLKSNLWYSLLGWRNSDLIDANHDPRPAYEAYTFSSQTLRSVYKVEELGPADVDSLSGLKGYKFNSDNGEVWILWSLDGATHTVTLMPGTPTAIFDAFGNPQATGHTINVGLKPLYLKWE